MGGCLWKRGCGMNEGGCLKEFTDCHLYTTNTGHSMAFWQIGGEYQQKGSKWRLHLYHCQHCQHLLLGSIYIRVLEATRSEGSINSFRSTSGVTRGGLALLWAWACTTW